MGLDSVAVRNTDPKQRQHTDAKPIYERYNNSILLFDEKCCCYQHPILMRTIVAIVVVK
jgi:hypothetical protein